MRLLKPLAAIVFWMGLWISIPAVLLYPIALWLARHTQISGLGLGRSYMYALAGLFFPTAFLVDWVYRALFRSQRPDRLNDPAN